jgi:hypothetical protein
MSSRFKPLARAGSLCASSARNAKMPIGSKTVRVFISHSDEDKRWANEIATKLKEAGLHVWDPDAELYPGDNWHLEIGKALAAANAMIVLMSPAAAESKLLREEISYAIGSERFRDRLIPVVVRPTNKMPWILKTMRPEKGSPDEVSKRIIQRLKASKRPNNRPKISVA